MATPIIIISGAPGTGKTTVSRQIADRLSLPLLSKDTIKELLFDMLGCGDLEWSHQLGRASAELLYQWVAIQLKARRSCVVENAFHVAYASSTFLELKQAYDAQFFQIYCTTEATVLLERLKRRAGSDERHPGHPDQLIYDNFEAILPTYGILPIGGTLLEVDTTDWNQVDVAGLIAAIQASEAAL